MDDKNGIFCIDVETRNEGFDVKRDNEELLSCQLGDDNKQTLFYNHSDSNNFDNLKQNVKKLLESGAVFIGYYIEFDLENLKKFLGITIPKGRTIDIMSMEEFQFLKNLKNTNYVKLEDACKHFGIDVSHKMHMKNLAEDLKSKNPTWREDAINYIKSAGFSISEDEVMHRINKKAFGMTISKSYDDFSKNQDKNSLFYKYAIGDILSEFKLFMKLREKGIAND